jgi:hypothetical protein
MISKTKNSFNFNSFDRFNDDLCEVLVSYLSISDKIRLECVSKHWKNLIFNKQKIIFINYIGDKNEEQSLRHTTIWQKKLLLIIVNHISQQMSSEYSIIEIEIFAIIRFDNKFLYCSGSNPVMVQ